MNNEHYLYRKVIDVQPIILDGTRSVKSKEITTKLADEQFEKFTREIKETEEIRRIRKIESKITEVDKDNYVFRMMIPEEIETNVGLRVKLEGLEKPINIYYVFFLYNNINPNDIKKGSFFKIAPKGPGWRIDVHLMKKLEVIPPF